VANAHQRISEDLRNSLSMWVGGIALALIYWAALHFDVFAGVPQKYVQGVGLLILAVNLIQIARFFSKRRQANKREMIDG